MKLDMPYKVDKANVVSEKFDNEIVIINLESGNYYSLEGIGFDTWSLIEKGNTLDKIIEWIISRYDSGKAEEINKLVRKFMAELRDEGLIIPDESPKKEDMKSTISQNVIITVPGNSLSNLDKMVLHKYTDMQDFLLVDPIHEVEYTDWPKS